MNRSYIYNLLILLLLPIGACNSSKGSQEKVLVEGIVRDASTGEPIPNAQVVALCWKESGFETGDIDYLKKEVRTDYNGTFSIKLERDYLKIDIASKSNNYLPQALTLKNYKEIDELIEIPLKKFKVKKPAEIDFNEEGVIFTRVYSYKKGIEIWGFNIKNGKRTNIKPEADIWIEQLDTHHLPKVLVASGNGGVIPIFKQDSTNPLIFSFTEAPLEGYFSTYKLTGKEDGFFVRTNDGKSYGKIIFNAGTYSSTEPTEKGHFKEIGLNFSYVFQKNGSTDLSILPTIDLEQYILTTL